MKVKIIYGLGLIIWEVFRIQMSKLTLLRAPNCHILNRELITRIELMTIQSLLPEFLHTHRRDSLCHRCGNNDMLSSMFVIILDYMNQPVAPKFAPALPL